MGDLTRPAFEAARSIAEKPRAVPERAPAADHPYDPVEEEPDLDILLQSRRQPSAKPYSRWRYGYAVEGEWDRPLSQSQRNYAAAQARHFASQIQDPYPEGETPHQRAITATKRSLTEARVAIANAMELVRYLAETRDPAYAASVTGLDETTIRELLRERRPRLLKTKRLLAKA